MAHIVPSNTKIFLAYTDISGDSNSVTLNSGDELPDDTTFGDTFRNCLNGLKTVEIGMGGFVNTADDGSDEVIQDNLGLANVPLLIAPTGGAAGEPCYFGPIAEGEYSPELEIGEIFKWELSAKLMSTKWSRGTVLWGTDHAAITGTANGAGFQLTTVGATQKLYAFLAVHTTSSLTDMDVILQSDDNSGFTTATTRITFTQFTAKAAQFPTPVAGAIADDYWRFRVSSFNGTSAHMIGAIAIQ